VIRRLKRNATREYMRSIGKLGGQNKFPRLSNNRKIADWLEDYVLDSEPNTEATQNSATETGAGPN
ncbi:MAG: hypothetical protein AAF570_23720, partial [Bacteroidota bacterium]